MGKRGQHIARDRQRRLQGRRVVGLSRRQQLDADAAEAKAMAADALAHIKRERAADEAEALDPPARTGDNAVLVDPPGGEGGEGNGTDTEQGTAADTEPPSASGEADP